jgi:hypothetical protein
VTVDFEAVRMDLHEAVDRVIGRYLEMADRDRAGADSRPAPTAERPVITRTGSVGPWTYTWWAADEHEEIYEPAWTYEVATPAKTHRVVLGWTTRSSWGRSDRKRAVVFWQSGSPASQTYYPWTEFVQTDRGGYAAPIPNPDHPRRVLTEQEPLPDRFRGADIQRSDQLFEQIAKGPSLRLVVDATDEEAMIRHGYWVATLRGRF